MPATDLPPARQALQAAVAAARRAGAVLRRGFGTPLEGTETKAHRHDPVTIYDREADRVIAEVLLAADPHAGLVSEEAVHRVRTGDLCWIVDPLDGTNNFLRGVPDFAVSIALVDSEGPLVGCIYDPLRDELYTAVRGAGAERNGNALRVSSQFSLDGAVLGVGFSTEPARRSVTLAQLPAFSPHVRALRIVGSAALDLAYVAAGRFDATWYLSLHDWDIAAGRLLVTEAGGHVTDLAGGLLVSPTEAGILASNGPLHPLVLAALRAPSRS
ncbi:MAG: inositol monophosphatase [Candidatus Bipolaricaulota bacterium]|nr:inositol monophosphatase [Candidatus Bipolaricaulota bacterium]